jgi:hypothetical protein
MKSMALVCHVKRNPKANTMMCSKHSYPSKKLWLALLAPIFFLSSAPHHAQAATTFRDTFSLAGLIEEKGSIPVGTTTPWWINSGGQMLIEMGRGKTIQGSLPALSAWRVLYAANNPVDTDEGYHPQNIFRLVQTGIWKNFAQEGYFRIAKMNMSESPNRNASNGVLLFNRYVDSNNLYYAGIRVDGTAVIKKKKNGSYYTLAQKAVFTGTYDHDLKPNLLPLNTWLGLRAVIATGAEGSVIIDLYMDKNWTGTWTKILSATDDGITKGGSTISSGGHAGIRTDFMDVEFDQYKISES